MVLNIDVDVSEGQATIKRILRNIDRLQAPRTDLNVAQAVRTAIEFVQATWISYIQGATVTYSGGTFQVRSISGEYVRSIQSGMAYPALGDALMGEVISTSPHGLIVEGGIRSFDMKQMLLSKGKKYITVPFRHGTPGTTTMEGMPQQVYDRAKGMGQSIITSRRREGGFTYKWGERLGDSPEGQRTKMTQGPGELAQKYAYTWKTGKYSGMVKMNSGGHSEYLTFRRMSVNSDPNSWQFPGVPPRKVTEAVAENTNDQIIDLIRVGFEMDLLDALEM